MNTRILWVLWCCLLCFGSGSCGGEATPLADPTEKLLRFGASTPLRCTPGELSHGEPASTYGESFTQPGWVDWQPPEAYQLDVDRYPSIVEVRIYDVHNAAPPSAASLKRLFDRYASKIRLQTARVWVVEALKGPTPEPRDGIVGFARHARDGPRDRHVGFAPTTPAIGGWKHTPGTGLVFAPVATTKPFMLGCLEAHYVPERPPVPHDEMATRAHTSQTRAASPACSARTPTRIIHQTSFFASCATAAASSLATSWRNTCRGDVQWRC